MPGTVDPTEILRCRAGSTELILCGRRHIITSQFPHLSKRNSARLKLGNIRKGLWDGIYGAL